MKRRMNIAAMKSKMQSAARHLASLCPSRFFTHHSSHSSLFTHHSSLFTIHYSLLILLLISCYREPLELYVKGSSEVQISYDWSRYNGPIPNGLTLMYALNGDRFTEAYPTHDITLEEREKMDNGFYKMIVMTKTPEEYEKQGTMNFYNKNSYENMMAVSTTYDITSETAWDKGRRYMNQPEPVGVAIDSFEVNVDNDGRIFYEYDRGADSDTLRQKKEVTILPMTTTLNIRVKIVGINYLKDPQLGGADGYITGMADGFYVSQKWRRSQTGDIKLNNWRKETTAGSRASNPGGVGYIVTSIETFGLPHGKELLAQRTEASNFLKLHFTKLDGDPIEFSYNVGKLIRYRGDTGSLEADFSIEDVALQLDLQIDAPFMNEDDVPHIPYAQPSGTGAFDAEVSPWGDEESVDVPM